MLKSHFLLAALFTTFVSRSTAHAETKLTTTVYTATPAGFHVDSTLVAGERDAVFVDAQFDLANTHRLIAMLLESKKNLTIVYVTHYHPDHYFGLVAIRQAFPKAQLVALPGAVAEIEKTW